MDRDELVRACQGLVRSLAWQEHQRIGRRIELDDLIQYGQMGLLRAADRFDPERGNAFTTYAYTCIHGAILDGLRELKWFNIRDYAGGRYQRISRQVLDDDGGSDAAAGSSGDAEGDANWLANASGRLAMAYIISSLDGGEQDASQKVADDAEPTPDSELLLGEVRSAVREQLGRLPRQTREFMEAVYYEGLSLTDAGAKFGMSKFKASRLHSSTLQKLARALRRGGIESP